MDRNKDRQTGWTTAQIQLAPRGAIYVWPFVVSLAYPKSLARFLGRDDLEIIPEATFRMNRVAGRRNIAVVIDHATELTAEGWQALKYVEQAAKANATP